MNVIVKNDKLSGCIDGISSKSYAHRAIFCAVLSKKSTTLIIDTLSEDIIAAINVVRDMGSDVELSKNILKINPPKEFNNNLVLNVGESGTTLRFLIPTLAVLGISAKIIRSGSLINRTNEVYFNLFPKYNIDIYEKDESIYIRGKLFANTYEVKGDVSSQFISGLLIALASLNKKSKIIIKNNLESKPYVDMTIDVLREFGANVLEEDNSYTVVGEYTNNYYEVEKDWSNALFFLCAEVSVLGLNKKSKQADIMAIEYLKNLGYENISKDNILLKKINKAKDIRIIDASNMPDSVPVLSMISALTKGYTKVINIKRLRLKESDRVKSTIELLTRLGVDVEEKEDYFSFYGVKEFKSCKINSYNDHRIAMTAAVAATYSNKEVEIVNAESVNKSYINFFDDFRKLGGKIDVL